MTEQEQDQKWAEPAQGAKCDYHYGIIFGKPEVIIRIPYKVKVAAGEVKDQVIEVPCFYGIDTGDSAVYVWTKHTVLNDEHDERVTLEKFLLDTQAGMNLETIENVRYTT